jgi:hypothetical protein
LFENEIKGSFIHRFWFSEMAFGVGEIEPLNLLIDLKVRLLYYLHTASSDIGHRVATTISVIQSKVSRTAWASSGSSTG